MSFFETVTDFINGLGAPIFKYAETYWLYAILGLVGLMVWLVGWGLK